MSFSQTVHRTWDRNQLFTALIELTYACNLKCVFCYNDLGLPGTPLALHNYFELLDDLAALSALNVTLSGGEPLAHPNFFQIGAHAKALGFVVRIKSNGHALKPVTAQRIRDEIDPFVIEVSLHGARAATHDRQTQVDGSFSRLMTNLEHLKRLGMRVKINSVLTKWNEDELDAMLKICSDLDIPLQIDTDVKPRDDGDRSPLELQATEKGRKSYHAYASKQLRMAREESTNKPERTKHCGAGSSTVAIDPYGNVLPCVQWRMPVGNLHQTRLRDLWPASLGLQEVRRTTEAARTFVATHGGEKALGGFCPGMAHTHSGNPLSLYPAIEKRIKVTASARYARRELPVVYETAR